MRGIAVKAKTALALGLPNLARVAAYRLLLRFGIHPVQKLVAELPEGPFFQPEIYPACVLPQAVNWVNEAYYFDWYQVNVGAEPPDWYLNPFTQKSINTSTLPWWKISDFNEETGDIKTIWEASRFDWVVSFACESRRNNKNLTERLNVWLADWCTNNPPYFGVNWKCGQESSIRVLHLALAAMILEQTSRPSGALLAMVKIHLQRIAPTMSYAIAQDNNHGTSEAAALYIGGSWLAATGDHAGKVWQNQGEKWLNNRVFRLIEKDGSFSQYSLNYHRMMLDTMSLVEAWRRQFKLSTFSAEWYERVNEAALWLFALVDPVTGDAPNLGANDGARLLQFPETGYRDFRPSIQLAMALFSSNCAYSGDGVWNAPLKWLKIPLPEATCEPIRQKLFDDGGYAITRSANAMALIRFPRLRFRPSQADALHVDFWVNSKNYLRDAGTYSYNAGDEWLEYFSGTAGHNTIQFDDENQMPRLSRFLFGEWLKSEPVTEESLEGGYAFSAGYKNHQKVWHLRKIALQQGLLRVEDTFDGFKEKAVLRWRLCPGDWKIQEQSIEGGGLLAEITADKAIDRFELVDGWESRYYLQKSRIPVLEVELKQAGTIVSEFRFHS